MSVKYLQATIEEKRATIAPRYGRCTIGLFRDRYYAPCCYLIIKVTDDGLPLPYHGENERNSVLVQTDYDWPGIARTFGGVFEDNEIGKAGEWLSENAANAAIAEPAIVSADDPGYFPA